MCYNGMVALWEYYAHAAESSESFMENLKHKNKVVGLKQVKNALLENEAKVVYLAEDASPGLIAPIAELCRENGVEPVLVKTRKELGKMCGTDVPAAAAAII